MRRVAMRWPVFVLVVLVLGSCTQGGERDTPSSFLTPPDMTIGAERPPEVVVVPSLIGVSIKKARVLLGDVGLKLGEVQVVTGDYTDAAIVEQHPSAGTEAEPGAAIDVVSGPAR
jgi:hypothetical protein